MSVFDVLPSAAIVHWLLSCQCPGTNHTTITRVHISYLTAIAFIWGMGADIMDINTAKEKKTRKELLANKNAPANVTTTYSIKDEEKRGHIDQKEPMRPGALRLTLVYCPTHGVNSDVGNSQGMVQTDHASASL